MRWWWFGPSVTRRTSSTASSPRWPMPGSAGSRWRTSTHWRPRPPSSVRLSSWPICGSPPSRAHELGLRFDLTLGSGWSFGGPHITAGAGGPAAALGAARDRARTAASAGRRHPGRATTWWSRTSAQVRCRSSRPSTSGCPSGTADRVIEAGAGPRVVLLAYAPADRAERQARGGSEPRARCSTTTPRPPPRRTSGPSATRCSTPCRPSWSGSVFCDSLEVYGADWTPGLPEEFARRRGYELLPQLYLLTVDGPEAMRVRADYHRTLAELYEENFVAVCQRWAAGRGVPFRIQSYGTPPARSAATGSPTCSRARAGAGARSPRPGGRPRPRISTGADVVSAEIWTWVHSPSFRATPLDLKGEAHEHLLERHQPAHRSRLALLTGRRARAGLVLLRRRGARRPQPLVAGDAAARRLPDAGCAGCCGRASRSPTSRSTCPTEDLFATMGRAQGGSLDTWREASAADRRRDPGDHPDGRAGLRPDRRRRARGHRPRALPGGDHSG